jgi:hypothetical protein
VSSGSKDKWEDFMTNHYPSILGQLQKAHMGIGEAAQEKPTVADIRIEKIENGYLVVYSKRDVAAKRKYAKDMHEVGEVTKQACIELELTGAK